jgi:hypothetical protein
MSIWDYCGSPCAFIWYRWCFATASPRTWSDQMLLEVCRSAGTSRSPISGVTDGPVKSERFHAFECLWMFVLGFFCGKHLANQTFWLGNSDQDYVSCHSIPKQWFSRVFLKCQRVAGKLGPVDHINWSSFRSVGRRWDPGAVSHVCLRAWKCGVWEGDNLSLCLFASLPLAGMPALFKKTWSILASPK